MNSLEFKLRRVRSSVRTDVNTGSRTQSGTKSYNCPVLSASKGGDTTKGDPDPTLDPLPEKV